MRKRISIFAGLLAVLVGAISIGVMGTGAYFTDSETGSVSASTGTLDISQVGSQSLTMDFGKIAPGNPTNTYKEATFKNTGSESVHVYLRGGAPAGLGGLTATEKAQLSIYMLGGDNSGGFSAAGPFFHDYGVVAPGGTVKVDASLALSSAAGNEWQSRSVSLPLTVIANQVDAPALTA
jgi:predicted ribosomally synthesized peptide with SipW-like signal peptide